MILKFKSTSLCNLFSAKLLLPQERLKSITLSFPKRKKKVKVLLDIDYLSDIDIERHMTEEMRKTLKVTTARTNKIPKGNAFKFRAEFFDDAKQWIKSMPEGVIRYVTVSFNGDHPGVDVLVYTTKQVTLNHMRDYLQRVKDGHEMWESVQRAQQYTGERINFLLTFKYAASPN